MEIDKELKISIRAHLGYTSNLGGIIDQLEERHERLLRKYYQADSSEGKEKYLKCILQKATDYAHFQKYHCVQDSDKSYPFMERTDMSGQAKQPYGDIDDALSARPLDSECLLADMAIAMRFSDKIAGEPRVAEFRKNVLGGRLMSHIRIREEVDSSFIFSLFVNEHRGAPLEDSLAAEWEELNSIAKDLSKKYGIEYGESRLIVLSGRGVLRRQNLSIIMSAEGTIMRVPSNFPDTAVACIYRQAQRKLAGTKNRVPKSKLLALFVFVNQLQNSLGKLPSWPEILERWNEECNHLKDNWTNGKDPKTWIYSNSTAHSEGVITPSAKSTKIRGDAVIRRDYYRAKEWVESHKYGELITSNSFLRQESPQSETGTQNKLCPATYFKSWIPGRDLISGRTIFVKVTSKFFSSLQSQLFKRGRIFMSNHCQWYSA